MRPQFRGDLKAAREEQQGVVFYRIDDPQTQTSFRLYEIEYLIARKLDGSRTLDEVIGAVKADYNFDITSPDLRKFVSQLESMGFIMAATGAALATAPTGVTAAPMESAPTMPLKDLASQVAAQAREKAEAAKAVPVVAAPEPVEIVEEIIEDATPLEVAPAFNQDEFSVPTVERMAPPLTLSGDGEGGTMGAGAEARRSTTSPEEVVHMVRKALEHLRQGFLIHARDYFNAAKESRPEDERIAKMASLLAVTSDEATPDEVAALWEAARGEFGELAAEVAADLEGTSLEDPPSGRSRWVWTAALVVVVLAGVVGLFFIGRKMHLFDGAIAVEVKTLSSERAPIFHAEPATSIKPAGEVWLGFGHREGGNREGGSKDGDGKEGGGKGKVQQIAAVGDRVVENQVVATLALGEGNNKKLESARQQVALAKEAHDKAAEKLAAVVEEQEQARQERDAAEAELKELRPKSILKSGGVSKKDLEKLKKVVVKAQKKLSKLAKKDRKPRTQEKKAKTKLEGAQKKLEQLESKLTGKLLRAPFAGEVAEVKAAVGDNVTPDLDLVWLRDLDNVEVTFVVPSVGDLQPGGEAHVGMGNEPPVVGKVLAIEDVESGKQLKVKLAVPAGVELKAESTFLVREFAEGAFVVDPRAVIEPENAAPMVYVAVGGHALRREIEVLDRKPNRCVIRSPHGELRDGEQLVVAAPDAGSVAAIAENASLEIAAQ